MPLPVRCYSSRREALLFLLSESFTEYEIGRTKARQSLSFSYIPIREKRWNPKGCQWEQTQSWTQSHWAGSSGAINLQPSICKYAGDWVRREKNNFQHLWYSFCSRSITLLVYWWGPEFAVLWSIRGLCLGHHTCFSVCLALKSHATLSLSQPVFHNLYYASRLFINSLALDFLLFLWYWAVCNLLILTQYCF